MGKYYNPDLDFDSKMRDMTEDWQTRQKEKIALEQSGQHYDDDDEYSEEAHSYFERTSGEPMNAIGGNEEKRNGI